VSFSVHSPCSVNGSSSSSSSSRGGIGHH
jgi:hypothetical protein